MAFYSALETKHHGSVLQGQCNLFLVAHAIFAARSLGASLQVRCLLQLHWPKKEVCPEVQGLIEGGNQTYFMLKLHETAASGSEGATTASYMHNVGHDCTVKAVTCLNGCMETAGDTSQCIQQGRTDGCTRSVENTLDMPHVCKVELLLHHVYSSS